MVEYNGHDWAAVAAVVVAAAGPYMESVGDNVVDEEVEKSMRPEGVVEEAVANCQNQDQDEGSWELPEVADEVVQAEGCWARFVRISRAVSIPHADWELCACDNNPPFPEANIYYVPLHV